MFNRFLDYLGEGEEDDQRRTESSCGKFPESSSGSANACPFPPFTFIAQEESESSSSSTANTANEQGKSKKRRVREDYKAKYAYLDYATSVDYKGLFSLADDVKGSAEILQNSYLPIVNSLVILNERRRIRENLPKSNATTSDAANSLDAGASKNFINSKVALNFKRSSNSAPMESFPGVYEWKIERFCDPATRDGEFQHLFQDCQDYCATVAHIKKYKEELDMPTFISLVQTVSIAKERNQANLNTKP